MSDVKMDGRFNLTKQVVMVHPNLFTPRAFGKKGKEQGEPKYSGNFVFPPDHPDLGGLKAAAVKVAKAKWPDRDIGAEYKAGTLKFPFANGTKIADKRAETRKAASKEPDGEFNRGNTIVAARSKYEPRLSGIENGKLVDYEGPARAAASAKFYFGVEVLAVFNFVAYDGVGANPDGVTAYLDMVLSTGKGKKLGGTGPSAAEVFKGYVGNISDEDPTAGEAVADEMPF